MQPLCFLFLVSLIKGRISKEGEDLASPSSVAYSSNGAGSPAPQSILAAAEPSADTW